MIRPEPSVRRFVRPLGDLVVGVAAFYCAFLVRMHLPIPLTDGLLPKDRLEFFVNFWPLVALAQVAALYFFGLYDRSQPRQAIDRARRLLPAVTLLGLGLGAFFFLTDRTFPRSVLVIFTALDFFALGAWRAAVAVRMRQQPLRLALIGGGSVAVELADTLRRDPSPEIELAGWIRRTPRDRDDEDREVSRVLGPCLGGIEDLPRLMRSGVVDDVVIAEDDSPWRSRLLDTLALARGEERGNVLLLPGPFESTIGRMRYRWVQDLPLIEVVRDTEWKLLRPVKRTLDLLAGTVVLLLAAPVILVCAVAVKLTSPGPVFYRQERVGRGFERFTVWKLRTMHVDAEPESREILATLEDPRLTPPGALLRRLRLDELPQLFNVLGGSMSLVGPRPERPGFVRRYLDEVPGYAERFSVAPGLTGLAQINGEYHSTARNKLRYDLAYIANWSVWLDLAILVRTIKIVLTSRGV